MTATTPKRRVLLIGWDAADWEHITPLLDEGLLPTLDRLIDRGVMGNLATLQPILSPMLWNSVATGKFADKHGIHGFIEPDPVNGGARPYTSTARKCKALWNILTECGLRSNVVGWWASHPAEPINGTVVTNGFAGVKFDPTAGWSIPKGTVHPAEKGPALARFRVFPSELTHEHILPFIPEAGRIDQTRDQRLSSFAKILSDAASIHAVATALMEAEPWDFTAVYYDAVDHFSHAFMPYHPPRLDWVPEEEFVLYKNVIRGAYRFHDMMLERLLQLAGPETTVILCSDHGFESGSQRPRGIPREPAGPAAWHREFGIFVIAGPGIRRDERIYGASLVDIAPTVLTLFDLPLGRDMDGRPLLEVFEEPPDLQAIETWESTGRPAGMHAGDETLDADQAQELMQQFAALGYIEDPGADKEKQHEAAELEASYNLARTYAWTNRPNRALPLFEELVRRRPWEDRFLSHLASCYFQSGFLRQAERVLSAIWDGQEPENASGLLLLARIDRARGDLGRALERVNAAQALNPTAAVAHTQIGDAFASLLQWEQAHRAYEQAVALDQEEAMAWQGLSTVFRHQGHNQQTLDAALRAVSLLHRLPIAHFNIGVAMARSGENARAITAFETALRFQPKMVNAHRYLAVLQADLGNAARAAQHRAEVAQSLRERPRAKSFTAERSEKVFDLPPIPARAERLEILLRERPDPPPPERSGRTFILVSGLPRSGTSMMMQILAAGGLAPKTDHERAADVDNPKGYFEWEALKQIAREPELLDEPGLERRAIKCISMLLPKLPPRHDYKVILMTRPVAEVVQSQRAMTDRLGTRGASLDEEQLARGLAAHLAETRQWLEAQPNVEVLELDYPSLVREPQPLIAALAQFIGADLLPKAGNMAAAVDPQLYRRRREAGSTEPGPAA